MHQGQKVKQLVHNSGYKVSRITEVLGISRAGLYKLYDQPQVNFQWIKALCTELGLDIDHHFPGVIPDRAPGQLEKEMIELQRKYIALLEKYNQLLVKVEGE